MHRYVDGYGSGKEWLVLALLMLVTNPKAPHISAVC